MNEQDSLLQVKEFYDQGFAVVNGREYHFTQMNHGVRMQVYPYFTHIAQHIQRGDLMFMMSDEFKRVEKVLWNRIMFNGSLIAKIENHWDEYPEDYQEVVLYGMSVISFPFLRASLTDSQSQGAAQVNNTSKKPM